MTHLHDLLGAAAGALAAVALGGATLASLVAVRSSGLRSVEGRSAVFTASFAAALVPAALLAWWCGMRCAPGDGTMRLASPRPLLWTVHNRRYDLAGFDHPGGPDALGLGRGRNCTVLFESYHTLTPGGVPRVRAVLERHFVECVEPGDADYDDRWDWSPAGAPFRAKVVERVRRYFGFGGGRGKPSASTGGGGTGTTMAARQAHKAPPAKWARCFVFVLLTFAAAVAWAHGWLCSLVLLPLAYWWGPSTLMHDGGHFALSVHPGLNRWMARLGAVHMSLPAWQTQHTLGHHMNTNELGKDPDLLHFSLLSEGGFPGFRISPDDTTGSIEMSHTMAAAARDGVGGRKEVEIEVWTLKRVYWRAGLLIRFFLTTAGPSFIWDLMSRTSWFGRSFLGVVPFPCAVPAGLKARPSHASSGTMAKAPEKITTKVKAQVLLSPSVERTRAVERRAWVTAATAQDAVQIVARIMLACAVFAYPIIHGTLTSLTVSGRGRGRRVHEMGHEGSTGGAAPSRNATALLAQGQRVHGVLSEDPGIFTHSAESLAVSAELAGLQELRGLLELLGPVLGLWLGFMRGVLFGVVPIAIHGGVFYIFSQVSHIQAECFSHDSVRPMASPSAASKPQLRRGRDWAAGQVMHTADYCTDSTLWLHLSNGLNNQIVHHLFPSVDWTHYPDLAAIVRDTATEFGVPHTEFASFAEALRAHFAYLRVLND